jgi:hypothetical protein
MRLYSDSERRVWSLPGDQRDKEAVVSEVWGQYREKDDDRDADRGCRLQFSSEFVFQMLGRMNMDLIVGIEVKRRSRFSRYEKDKDHELGYIPKSVRLFLAKADGSLCAI